MQYKRIIRIFGAALCRVYFGLFVLCAFVFAGCEYFNNNSLQDDVLARVGDKVLLRSDVKTILSEFSGRDDSMTMAKNFINSWVKKQVLIAEADKYLKSVDVDFSQQLEDYKNSLMAYAYENDIANKELDTIVSEEEISNYYDSNKDKFTANEPLFKGIYFKVLNDSVRSVNRRVPKMAHDRENIDKSEIELFCNNSTLDFVVSVDKFVPLQTIVDKMPFYSIDAGKIYQKGGFTEFKDSDYTHYVYISRLIERGDITPLEECSQSVKRIILRQRRFDFIDRLNKQLYDKAVENGDIEIF